MAAAARLPWLSRGGSHSDLEAGSSHSLLQSIYGSQVSQVLLASSDSSTNLAAGHGVSDRRLTRPKSSPAASSLERERRRERAWHYAMPPTQRQVRTRPSTAYARGSGSSQWSELSRRPASALPCRASSPLVLEDVENASPARTNIHDTMPVTLTRVPEYVNFWQGKPLSIREHAVPVHKRRAWQRPKSDYGSRTCSRDKSGQALATVMESVDGSIESTNSQLLSNTNKVGSGVRGKYIGDSGTQTRGNKDDGLRSNGSGERNGSEDGREGLVGIGGRARTTNMWAERSKRSKRKDDCSVSNKTTGCGDDEDNFFYKDKHTHSHWLEVGGHGAATTRFELPMDLVLLEQMSPLQYLKAHCIISHHHTALCSRVFTKLDKDRDGYLTKQEVEVALQEALHGSLTQAQAQHLLAIVQYLPEAMADLHLFTALCCLAERVFSIHLLPALAGKQVIECVDFEALEWKLRGCSIGQPLQQLFTLL